MKAIRVNLTFFYDESKVGEQEIKDRLERLLAAQFQDMGDRDIHWLENGPPSGSVSEDLAAKLERLDT